MDDLTWWQRGLARWGVRTPLARDTLAAVVLAALVLGRVLLYLFLVRDARADLPFSAWALTAGYALATADIATIAFRRHRPRTALAVATVIPLLSALLPTRPPLIGVGILVCSYTVASLLRRREAGTILAVCATAHLLGGAAIQALGGDVGGLVTFWGTSAGALSHMVVAVLAAYGLPGLLGSYVQVRRAYARELAARLERLERDREERARSAVADERARIARELHDIAAHDLSAIVVQAGAAERQLDRDPDAARDTLRAIRAQGRDTLSALRELVGIMRDAGSTGLASTVAHAEGGSDGHSWSDGAEDDAETGAETDSGGRTPQPTLARLDELITRARATGMVVDLTSSGRPRPLSPTVELAAYRVIQEGLTNARHHAPGAPVSILTAYDDGGLRVTIRNPTPGLALSPPGAPAAPPSGGHGLVGMRERVGHARGSLRVGPADDAGWQVDVRFPAPDVAP